MIEERYLTATMASSLKDEAHKIGQVDIIKASGMSDRNLAAHYLRLISKPTKEDMTRVYAALLYQVEMRKLKGGSDAIVTAINWLLNQNCHPCSGSGVDAKKGVGYKCKRCGGTGKRPEPSNPCAQILIDYVQTCRVAHAGRMFGKLR